MTLASIANKGTFPVSMMTSIYPMVLRYSFYKIVQAELQIRFFYESVTSHPSKENEKGHQISRVVIYNRKPFIRLTYLV